MGKRMTYRVYRSQTNLHSDLTGYLRMALDDFSRRDGSTLPVEVVVHGSLVDAAKAALIALDLDLAVLENGGCTTSEVWLGLEEPAA